jgi:hypothetical protein
MKCLTDLRQILYRQLFTKRCPASVSFLETSDSYIIISQWLKSPEWARGPPYIEASLPHTLHTPHSVGFLWTSMVPSGFELTIPAKERPQTHALDRAATGIGYALFMDVHRFLAILYGRRQICSDTLWT